MFKFHSYLALLAFCIFYFTSAVSGQTCNVTEFSQVENATRFCSELQVYDLRVPAGETLKLHVKDGAAITFYGYIDFDYKEWLGPLVSIKGNGIHFRRPILSGSLFDGEGALYWNRSSIVKPVVVRIEATNSLFYSLAVKRSPQDAIQVVNSANLTFQDPVVENLIDQLDHPPPADTDTNAIVISNSTGINIVGLATWTRGSCVMIHSGSNIYTYNTYCHETSKGIGFSVGNENSVALNTVNNVTFELLYIGAETGISIETNNNDGQGGSLSNLLFNDVTIYLATKFGIIVNQNHAAEKPNILISNMTMVKVTGAMLPKAGVTGLPVSINCAEGGCQNWDWNGFEMRGEKEPTCNFQPDGYNCVANNPPL